MYLAVHLFYERELVTVACRTALACSGDVDSIRDYGRRFPHAVWFRKAFLSQVACRTKPGWRPPVSGGSGGARTREHGKKWADAGSTHTVAFAAKSSSRNRLV